MAGRKCASTKGGGTAFECIVLVCSLLLSRHHSHASNKKKKAESGVSERGGYVFFLSLSHPGTLTACMHNGVGGGARSVAARMCASTNG